MDEQNIEDALARDGFCVVTIDGISMRPMLKGRRDVVVVQKTDRRLERYEVALYRRSSGRYVLHRVIGVRNGGYHIRGDNCLRVEKDIADHQVLGVMTGFYRAGRYVSSENGGYRQYVRLWRFLFPLRIVYLLARKLTHLAKNKSDNIYLSQTGSESKILKRSRS